jgi:hypothetical protein
MDADIDRRQCPVAPGAQSDVLTRRTAVASGQIFAFTIVQQRRGSWARALLRTNDRGNLRGAEVLSLAEGIADVHCRNDLQRSEAHAVRYARFAGRRQ